MSSLVFIQYSSHMDSLQQIWPRATKMLKGLKRLSSEERLRATTVQSREKALRGLVNVCEQLMEGNEELSHTLLSGAF